MIIELGHPIAKHLIVLTRGVPLAHVRAIDTARQVASVHDGHGFATNELQYDELLLDAHTPEHLREVLPGVRVMHEDETLPRPYAPEYPLTTEVKRDLRDRPYTFQAS